MNSRLLYFDTAKLHNYVLNLADSFVGTVPFLKLKRIFARYPPEHFVDVRLAFESAGIGCFGCGFQCIYERYRNCDTWKLTQPADCNCFQPDTTGFDRVNVKMEAGDLLIFISTLAHRIRPNLTNDKVHMAPYILARAAGSRRRRFCRRSAPLGENSLRNRRTIAPGP